MIGTKLLSINLTYNVVMAPTCLSIWYYGSQHAIGAWFDKMVFSSNPGNPPVMISSVLHMQGPRPIIQQASTLRGKREHHLDI